MQNNFFKLADHLTSKLQGAEAFTAYFSGEESDFVRLNKAAIRQAGKVTQGTMQLDLVNGNKHVLAQVTLSGQFERDCTRLDEILVSLRTQLAIVPEDPFLLFHASDDQSSVADTSDLPDVNVAIESILSQASGLDLVGIYAQGPMHRGFASSFGQRNWQSKSRFQIDFSLYAHGDKAVKTGYSGASWNDAEFAHTLARAKEDLAVLSRPAKTIAPGHYRAYLTPTAVNEIIGLTTWGGFSEKALRTKTSPLQMMRDDSKKLHSGVTISENIAAGIAAPFQANGFIRPIKTPLIEFGTLAGTLVSPRSAKEFSLSGTGANGGETPESLDMAGGTLKRSDVLKQLGTGLYINNLWYLNYSDKPAGRMTGMTRFATFWVENGEVVAPVNVMRFDDSIYRLLGDKLEALTSERELILDGQTYEERSTGSSTLPGALIDAMTFTL